jgi:hypothetical protein
MLIWHFPIYNKLGIWERHLQFTTTDWLTLALVVITGVYAWATFRF